MITPIRVFPENPIAGLNEGGSGKPFAVVKLDDHIAVHVGSRDMAKACAMAFLAAYDLLPEDETVHPCATEVPVLAPSLLAEITAKAGGPA